MGKIPLRIVSVGECTTDYYPGLQREFVGGISLNFAVHAKRSGAENVSLVSRIGDDYDRRILEKLANEGVNTSHVSILSGATARQNIVLNAGGERLFPPGGYHAGVLEGYRLQDHDLHFVRQHNVLASALFKQIEPLFRQVIELPFEGLRVADFLDLADYEKDIHVVEHFCEQLTIAFISGDHGMVEQLRPLSRGTTCLIVVTLGVEGSAALMKGEPIYQPPVPVSNVVDSTGCGDAFQAAFTVSYLRDRDVTRALSYGAQQAASVLQHHGAIS